MKDLKNYLKRLKELKSVAFQQIYRTSNNRNGQLPQSAFDFLDNEQDRCSRDAQIDVKAVMIFDLLCNETEIRPDQISIKLEEVGHKVAVSDLLAFNLFV